MIRTALVRTDTPTREALHTLGVEAACHAARETLAPYTHADPPIKLWKDERGKPMCRVGSTNVAVSISHTRTHALACATHAHNTLIGADIEHIRHFSRATYLAFTTTKERAVIEGAPIIDRARLETLAWVYKECVLKALGVGLRLHPAYVDTSALLVHGPAGENKVGIQGVLWEAEVCPVVTPPTYVAAAIALPKAARYT